MTSPKKSRDKKSPIFLSIQLHRNQNDLNSKDFSIKHVRIETVKALSLKFDTKEGIMPNRNNNCRKMNDA